MSDQTTDDIKSIDDVRRNIDRLDREIVPLLVERSRYVHAAARFKDTKAAVVVPERIDAIVETVRAQAQGLNGDPDLLEDLYRAMIDAYIRFEQRKWEEMKG